jgi:aspartokinase-like uncharacterized kinase
VGVQGVVNGQRTIVVKVGGSLLDWPLLPPRLAGLLDSRYRIQPCERPMLIAGGGPMVEVVRSLDVVHGLGDRAAHDLALRVMDVNAALLAALLPGSILAEGIEALSLADRVPVVVPRALLNELERCGAEPLPRSWDVTSDTIAAWLATNLGAASLVLLKSASLPAGASREEAARLELVDRAFPRAARALPRVEYVNLRDPEAALQILA